MENDETESLKPSRRRNNESKKIWLKQERNALLKKVTVILQKSESERTEDEKQVLLGCTEVAQEVTKRLRRQKQLKSRLEEVEDPPETLSDKCKILATAIGQAQHLVVYTGAGISTAARIPDYRGPNGVWTLLQQGKDVGSHDLSLAEPTLTHMALSQLYHMGRLKHIVSQNCDGLHLRSGLPRTALSEVHGNMYLEVCRTCTPPREYLRLFDVTERTARFSHKTYRRCHVCAGPLTDTIVHFGERGSLKWPLNWSATSSAAQSADVILCLGSSLKVLKKYPWLWCMDMPVKKRPLLYIVNLQWTPKDEQAALKINGRCDEVFLQVMSYLHLNIPQYDRLNDPIFCHFTPLHPSELRTTSRPSLQNSQEQACDAEISDLKETCVAIKSEDKSENCDQSTSKSKCDEENYPLDLTMKSVNSDDEGYDENKSITYQKFNTLHVDLNIPWFTMQYILSSSLFVKQEHNYCKLTDVPVDKGECQFCWSKYSSLLCLFYNRQILTERGILSDASSEEEEDSGDGPSNSKIIKPINPGWFGKGYRKTKVRKKKQSY